jgi:hypothetical protein
MMKDEAQYGEYRTKRMVLEKYEELEGGSLAEFEGTGLVVAVVGASSTKSLKRTKNVKGKDAFGAMQQLSCLSYSPILAPKH